MQIMPEDLLELVQAELGVRAVGVEDRLVEDLGAESVDIVAIVAAVEDKYSITIEEGELAELNTVADLVTLIRQRAGSG